MRRSAGDWGATTQRGDTVFVHVLNWRDRQLAIPAIERRIASARALGTGESVSFTQTPAGITLTLPGDSMSPDRVIALVTVR